jgi:hypothetical protein
MTPQYFKAISINVSAVSLSKVAFYKSGICCFQLLSVWLFLIMKECWVLLNYFFVCIETFMVWGFLFSNFSLSYFIELFSYILLSISLSYFHILDWPCFPGINPTWDLCIAGFNLLVCFWVFLEKFCFSINRKCWSVVLFVCLFVLLFFLIFTWCWYQGNTDLAKQVREESLLFHYFEQVWEGLVLIPFILYGRIQEWSHLVLKFNLWKMF